MTSSRRETGSILNHDFTNLRNNWELEEVLNLFDQPFNDLVFEAQRIHRLFHKPNTLQLSTLLSIKTGACPEDCKYCSQSGHYNTGLEKEKLLAVEKVLQAAQKAKASGAQRFCMGAAWRSPSQKDMPYVLEMVKSVKAMGLETCMTLGMLDADKAQQLADAGLDYYNHNLDTSPEHYNSIITTRSYQDRIDTLNEVRSAGIKVCSGGILGLGEARKDRASLLCALANLPAHPDSVPMNRLVPIKGTPLGETDPVDEIEFIKSIAIARLMMPASVVRLSAGRESLSESTQALCFLAGANSMFYGEALLTTANPQVDKDQALLQKLGITSMHYEIEEPQLDSSDQVSLTSTQSSASDLYIDAMAGS